MSTFFKIPKGLHIPLAVLAVIGFLIVLIPPIAQDFRADDVARAVVQEQRHLSAVTVSREIKVPFTDCSGSNDIKYNYSGKAAGQEREVAGTVCCHMGGLFWGLTCSVIE